MNRLMAVLSALSLLVTGQEPPEGEVRAVPTVLELSAAPGYRHAEATAVNDEGLVVGIASSAHNPDAPFQRALVWAGQTAELLPLSGAYSSSAATDVNDRGTIVGWGITAAVVDPRYRPLVWSGGEAQPLPLIPGHTDGAAHAINDLGEVVGWSGAVDGDRHAVAWRYGVPRLLGSAGSLASAVNNLGTAVGSRPGGAARWARGVESPLAGVMPGSYSGGAEDVNDRGVVVGTYVRPQDATSRALVWRGETAEELPAPASVLNTSARAINLHGHVVGFVEGQGDEGPRAALWRDGDLSTLDRPPRVSHAYATDVNRHGVVVGWGFSEASDGDGFRYLPLAWTPAS